MEQFGQHLLPSLLSLSSDPVANVRVLVAKALRQSVMEKGEDEFMIFTTWSSVLILPINQSLFLQMLLKHGTTAFVGFYLVHCLKSSK